MNVVDILKEARSKIERPENWCTEVLFKEREGGMAFCAVGAVLEVTGTSIQHHFEPALRSLGKHVPKEWAGLDGWEKVARFNNATSHKAVLDLFDRAIAWEKANVQVAALLTQATTPPKQVTELEAA